MEINFIDIYKGASETAQIRALYEEAFPANERMPFELLFTGTLDGGRLIAMVDPAEKNLLGMASVLQWRDILHILFLAVDRNARSEGLGGRMVEYIAAEYPGCRILADIESVIENAPNAEDRIRRKKFYLCHGFRESEVTYTWEGVDYLIMVRGKDITKAMFWDFWHHVRKKR